jgi:hypothetical protein
MIRASIGCWRAVCRCFEERLDDANIGAALEQMGGKAVAQPVQRHALLDSGGLRRLMEQAV